MTQLDELETKYDLLQKMAFPDSEKSEELGAWIFDLMEVDAYYSQIALAVLESQEFDLFQKADFQKVDTLKTRLESINDLQGNDRAHYNYCKMYLAGLEKLVQALQSCRD